MQKIINSNTAKYQPMLTDNLVLDDKPTVNSFNGITSDGVARAIAGASGEVPAVTESDNGKVLTAVYDEGGPAVEWADAASGVPAATGSDEGKVLGVTDNQGSVGWVAQTPAQIQSDWNQTNTSAADYIKNKPSIPSGVVVDQVYNSSSANAQSGVAVAQAIAAVPTASYTFSNPIKETSGTVSLDYDTDTLSASTTSWTQFDTFSSSASGDAKFRDSDGYTLAQMLNYGVPWSTISLHIPGNTYFSQNYNSSKSYFISLSTDPYLATSSDRTITYIGNPLATKEVTISGYTRTAVAEQDVVINYADLSNTSLWTPKQFNFSDEIYLGLVIADTSTTSPANEPLISVDDAATVPVKFSATVAAPLTVKNPLPVSTSVDEGKVLTVGSSGLEWVAPEYTPDYTMVYNTTPAGGSWDGEPWTALNAGKRIGCLVPYTSFSGTLAAGSIMSTGKIYMPLASVVNRGSLVYKWNFYLYDGANKWSLVLTCEEDEWSWGTPNVVPG